MAEIFLARAVGADRFAKTVVLKRLLPQLCEDDEYVAMFLQEARLCASLHHPNIAQVYDLGRAGQSYFFAMEYVHGATLRQVLGKALKADKQVPLEAVVAIGIAVASGLHYAHEKRAPDGRSLAIVHRDITPSNVLLRYDGEVKLVDFGIAKAADSELSTRTGTLKGKLAYMSPEQALGLKLDRRSDIFSLGILMYELATVSRLFRYDDQRTTFRKLVEADIAPPSTVREDLPEELSNIIMKMLARPPGGRYQTGEELAAELEQFAVSAKLAATPRAVARLMRALFGEPPPEIEDPDALAEGIALWNDAPGKLLATGSQSFSATPVTTEDGSSAPAAAAENLAAPDSGPEVAALREVAPPVKAAPDPRRSRRRRRRILLFVALAIVIAFDIFLWLGEGSPFRAKPGLAPAAVDAGALDAAPPSR